MRTLVIASFAIVLMASLAVSGTDAPVDPASNKSWNLTDVPPGHVLTLQLDTGAGLHITTWDRNEISVVSDLGDPCPDARITLTRVEGGARLESAYPDSDDLGVHQCSLRIDVRVPRRFDIRLRSAGGSVEIRELQGTVSGYTGGGRLALSQMHGEVRLRTGGGSIQVSDSDLEGSLTTGGGGISFDRVSGPVTASSGSVRGVVRGRSHST